MRAAVSRRQCGATRMLAEYCVSLAADMHHGNFHRSYGLARNLTLGGESSVTIRQPDPNLPARRI